jgi:stage V sporulation protein AB
MNQVILAIIGLSSGLVVAGGLFGFIIEIGIISDFADRTHTGQNVMLYEDTVALGGILGNLCSMYSFHIPYGSWLLPVFGLASGIFVGCWAMALAEVVNIFPIFVRRLKILKYTGAFIVAMAVGKGIGSLIYYYMRW